MKQLMFCIITGLFLCGEAMADTGLTEQRERAISD